MRKLVKLNIYGLMLFLLILFKMIPNGYCIVLQSQYGTLNYSEYILTLIIPLIRSVLLIVCFAWLQKLWRSEGPGRKVMSMKNIFSWLFLFMGFAKILDFYLILEYKSPQGIDEQSPFWLLQLRWVSIIFILMPLFWMFIYIYYTLAKIKYPEKREHLESISAQIAPVVIYIIIGLAIIYSANDYDSLKSSIILMTLPTLLLGLITFSIIWRNKLMKDFNAPLATILILFYTITQGVRGIVPDNVIWILELIDLSIWIGLALSYKFKPYYNKLPQHLKQVEEIY